MDIFEAFALFSTSPIPCCQQRMMFVAQLEPAVHLGASSFTEGGYLHLHLCNRWQGDDRISADVNYDDLFPAHRQTVEQNRSLR